MMHTDAHRNWSVRPLAETDLALGAICHRVVEISYGTEEIWK